MTQLLLDFSEILTDADGDTVVVDRLSDTEKIISRLLKCSRKKSREVLEKLSKDFDVYSNGFTTQLILAKDGRIIHNFEAHGETRMHGHKYNPVNEWDFRNKSTGINARFSNESQREIRSRTNNTKENGFTLQEHFEVANQIKEHSDTKHNQTNVRIERFLSQPIKLKSGKEARACITVKHSLDRNGHNIYSLEAMDIKNALEKTRAKGQPKDSDCPHADNITHDTAEVKSIAGLWRMIKSA